MTQTKNALGNLMHRYRAVLGKCHLRNTFGSLAVAAMLVLGSAGWAMGADTGLYHSSNTDANDWTPYDLSKSKHAGVHVDTGTASGGNVTLDTGKLDKWYFGGHTSNGSATGNAITIISLIETPQRLYGGYTKSGNASGNTVVMRGGVAHTLYGGHSEAGDASDNAIIMTGGTAYALRGGEVASGAGNARNNTVIFIGGTVTTAIYGADARQKDASGNTVIWAGGSVNNLVGGLAGTGTSDNNTLVIVGKKSIGGSISYFQHYRFLLPQNVANGDVMLDSGTRAVPIKGRSVGVAVQGGAPTNLHVGDTVTLISKTGGDTVTSADFTANLTAKARGWVQNYGFDLKSTFELGVDSGGDMALWARYLGTQQTDVADSKYVNNGDGLNEYIRATQDRGEIGDAFVSDMGKPAGVRFLSRAIASNFGNASTDAAKAVESSMNIATVAAVPQMTLGANLASVGAVTQRTAFAMPDGNLLSTGLSAGNKYDKTGFAMWIMPLRQSNSTFDMKAGDALTTDTRASIGGIAIGADYTWDRMFRLGLTFNIGGGYATGSGDFADTKNDMNFWGIGAYAGWAWNNFGLTADVNYTSTFNSISQELHPDFAMNDLKADVRAYAISAGLRGEYTFETAMLDITPHAGVRYTCLSTDDGYDVTSGGQTVLEADRTQQDIWTFPIGVQFAKSFVMDNGWYVKPSLDLSITPAAGDVEARRDVRFTGVSGALTTEAQTMDWVSYGGQAGLEFGNDNVKLGVNYNLQLGAHSTNHGVFGSLRYEF